MNYFGSGGDEMFDQMDDGNSDTRLFRDGDYSPEEDAAVSAGKEYTEELARRGLQ
jgi:hypothetical protein